MRCFGNRKNPPTHKITCEQQDGEEAHSHCMAMDCSSLRGRSDYDVPHATKN